MRRFGHIFLPVLLSWSFGEKTRAGNNNANENFNIENNASPNNVNANQANSNSNAVNPNLLNAVNNANANAANANFNAAAANAGLSNFSKANTPPTQNAATLGSANGVPLNAAPLNSGSANLLDPPINAHPANADAALPPVDPAALPTPGAEPNQQPPPSASSSPPLEGAQIAPPGGRFEIRYKFDDANSQPLHTFVLHWAGPSSNLQRIDVLASESSDLIQQIPVPQDRVHLIWQEVVSPAKEVVPKDKILDHIDYNFDKLSDLRLVRQWPYKVGEKNYLVWLFDVAKNQYALSEKISSLPSPWPDPKTQWLVSTILGNYGGNEYVARFYSVTKDGSSLQLQQKITQNLVSRGPFIYSRDIRQRRTNSDLQRVCKIIFPGEGRGRRIWGTAKDCAPFLTKETPRR